MWNAIFTWAEARLGLARVRGWVGGWGFLQWMNIDRCACSCGCGCQWGVSCDADAPKYQITYPLPIPGTQNGIKACVLIENVTASFQMDEVLHELRDHSAGLNCGIWDYSASFIARCALRFALFGPVLGGCWGEVAVHASPQARSSTLTGAHTHTPIYTCISTHQPPPLCRFAQRSDMVFPDRTKYVNMKCDFMQAYMRLLVDTCHKVRPIFLFLLSPP